MANEFMRNEQIGALADAMLTLGTRDEALAFFEDIFTVHEVQAASQRLAVARLLRQRVTYQDIAKRTGASTATISRVNRCLSYGTGGYQTVLTRMEQDDQADKNDEKQEEQP